jgi:hypothetical protein
MGCMPKQKKGRNSIMPKALQPYYMKITYECNMLNNDKIILPLLCKDNPCKKQNTKMWRWGLIVDRWGISCVWCNKWKVQCVNVLCEKWKDCLMQNIKDGNDHMTR